MRAAALFLDRDGVLNVRIPGAYITRPEDFIPAPGVQEAMSLLAPLFQPIIVVTNQAGIGKGLMTEGDLAAVHEKLLAETEKAGGRIDRIYHCPDRPDAGSTCRKPATGMAWLALADFPDLSFDRAWMVGDAASDMAFGKALGMKTVFIQGDIEEEKKALALKPDFTFASLLEFTLFYQGHQQGIR
jgi:histidinol-phosphate phosphatase family protein